jgi:hypothetical protein
MNLWCSSYELWIRSVRPLIILHHMSSDRREPVWFLSIMSFCTLVREDQVRGIILFVVAFY